jgi:CRISPR-associated protein Csx16
VQGARGIGLRWEEVDVRVLVTRHEGTIEWCQRRGVRVDRIERHLVDVEALSPGDVVIGNLPIPIVASLSARGVVYVHLDPQLAPEQRGRELGADEVDFRVAAFDARERDEIDAEALVFGPDEEAVSNGHG